MPKSLFDPQTLQDLTARLDKLTADTRPQWGKMNASEMLNHCTAQLQVMLGEKEMKSNFLLRFFGKFIKKKILSDAPTQKNSPTAKELLPNDVKSFADEKARLIALMQKMAAQQSALEGIKHPFFGTLTADECSRISWNHLDYHFGQFGI